MEVVKLHLNELLPNPNNPRTITPTQLEKLKNSIVEFPEMLETRPIIIDENNIVLGGNMRLQALKELGITEVPVKRVTGFTEEKKKEFVIKDNLSYGDWDWETLVVDWEMETLYDWGLEFNTEDNLTNNNTYEGLDASSKLDKFMNAEIKRMFLVFDSETFSKVVEWFDKKQEEFGVEDNNQVILKLMENE